MGCSEAAPLGGICRLRRCGITGDAHEMATAIGVEARIRHAQDERAFHLKQRDLSMVTDAGDIIVAAGTYTLSIGDGQPGTGAPAVSGTFEIDGSIALPQ